MKYPVINLYKGRSGETYLFEYYETDSIADLPQDQLSQVAIMAFHGDKLLIVNNTTKPGTYGPISGKIEKGESAENAVSREIKEESNMKISRFKLIGYQKCINQTRTNAPVEYQLRYFAQVEPYGPFIGDPDGDVTELLEINPQDYKKYFDWGEIGEEIIARAVSFL